MSVLNIHESTVYVTMHMLGGGGRGEGSLGFEMKNVIINLHVQEKKL